PRPGRASPAASRPTGSETAVERLQSYHVERSNEMDKEQQGDAAVASAHETAERPGFGEIGERVSAILQSAQDAADDIRGKAEEAAGKIEEDAIRHRKALLDESRALQTWLDQALTAFKEVTNRLDAVASSRPQRPEEATSEEEAPSLEEAVHPRGEYAKTQ